MAAPALPNLGPAGTPVCLLAGPDLNIWSHLPARKGTPSSQCALYTRPREKQALCPVTWCGQRGSGAGAGALLSLTLLPDSGALWL